MPRALAQAAGAQLLVGVRQRCGRQASAESRCADDHYGQANDGGDAAADLERGGHRQSGALSVLCLAFDRVGLAQSVRTTVIASQEGRCPSHDGSRRAADVRDAAGGSGSPPSGDHADPASRGRVDDVGDLLERQPDGDPRSAAQAGGSPFDAQVISRTRCCTCRILLLYWQQERPSPFLVRASDLQEYRSG